MFLVKRMATADVSRRNTLDDAKSLGCNSSEIELLFCGGVESLKRFWVLWLERGPRLFGFHDALLSRFLSSVHNSICTGSMSMAWYEHAEQLSRGVGGLLCLLPFLAVYVSDCFDRMYAHMDFVWLHSQPKFRKFYNKGLEITSSPP